MNALALTLLACVISADLPDDFQLSPPPGVYAVEAATPPASGFHEGQPTIATSYFYWYDIHSKAHIIDPDGSDALTDHPVTTEGLSYMNPDWHQRQLEDMMAAGVDVALPVYWGTPLGDFEFSDAGLPQLVLARQRLIDAGKNPPAIGMFYDTSTLRYNRAQYHVDLTTEAGHRWFYGAIRNCFSLIPPQHRACIDGRPLVFLYASAFAKDVDEGLFPAVREMFQRDFGTDFYLVKMADWPGAADSQYQWGGALRPQILDTAGIGPGYDHSAVPNRTPLVKERDDGQFYEFSWNRLLAMRPATRPWLVHLETWNEFHEGTEICETSEYGRKYIELTRSFADRFHRGEQIDLSKLGPARQVVSASPDAQDGITIAPKADGDGPIVVKTIQGKKAWATTSHRFSPTTRYMYFEVSDYFLYDADASIEVTISYYDAGPSGFTIQYDSNDPKLSGLQQAFREGPHVPIANTERWKEATVTIPHARFLGRANGADFRLACVQRDLAIQRVTIRRK